MNVHSSKTPSLYSLDVDTFHFSRIRKVKCDETRPACNRCVSTGRMCDGYPSEQNPKVVAKPKAFQMLAKQPAIQSWSRVEREAFSFYHAITAQALGGTTQGERDIWLRTIPQVAMRELAVRHALCALGSLHWYILQPSTDHGKASLDSSICQYKNAMSAVRTQTRAGLDVVLISCLLFTLYESFHGQQDYAMLHIRHGAKLLRSATAPQQSSLPPQTSPSPPSVHHFNSFGLCPHLKAIFLRFVRQLKELGGHPPDSDTFTTTPCQIPFTFQSTAEAARAFEAAYLAGIEAFSTDSSRIHVTRVGHFGTMHRWQEWCTAFDEFTGPLDTGFAMRFVRPELLHLLVYRNLCKIAIAISPSTSETIFDNHISDFELIVGLCSRLLETGQPINQTSNANPVPKLTLSSCPLIEVLYLFCWKCRDPLLRRRALRLLADMNVRDGLLDSCKLAADAAQIIETEERNALNILRDSNTRTAITKACDVPAAARLHSSMPLGKFLTRPAEREMLFHHHKHEHTVTVDAEVMAESLG